MANAKNITILYPVLYRNKYYISVDKLRKTNSIRFFLIKLILSEPTTIHFINMHI